MRRTLLVLAALLVIPTLAATTSAQPAVRGVTANEIVIGTSMPLSGPASFWGLGVGGGIQAYAGIINAQGGINGRRLRVVILDDAYLPPRAVANVRELVERHNVFAIVGLIGTANAFAVRDYIVDNKVIWISPTADASMWAGYRDTSHLFVTYPSYRKEGIVLAKYAVEQLKGAKLAVFYQNDLYGQMGLLGVKRGLAQVKGARLVGQASYETTAADVSAQAVKLRESGADTVVLYATPRHGALIAREMAKIGYKPKLVATFTLADPVMFQLAGDAWSDVYLTAFFPLPTEDQRVGETLQSLIKVVPDLARNPYNALAGYAIMEPFVEGLRRAGPNLTAETLIKAMEGLKNWDGAVIRGVNFGPKEHQGTNRLRMILASGGSYKHLGDWVTYKKEF